jgi:hypothetical protein
MPITTLTNHSVNPFGPGSNTGMLMPKLKYRFRVTLLGFGTSSSTELTKQVMDVTRPKVSFEEIPIDIYNSKIKLAGKYTWENITLNIRDDASSNVIKLVGQQIQKQFDFHEQASARSGIDYKFTTRIEVLDGGNGAAAPQVLEAWQCYGCFLQNTDYGDLNYTENSPATVALTIAYDSADNSPNAVGQIGVGTAGVFRNPISSSAVGSSGI